MKKYLLFKSWFIMALMVMLCTSVAVGQTLMHSYTFDNGTAEDVVGDADGTAVGGTFADSAYTAAANGEYITLPAADIAINTYSSITLEVFIRADVDVTWASMMTYFGGNENGVGGNGYFLTPDRWTESRTAISCGELTAPYDFEDGVTGPPVSVGEKHHVVSVLTNSTIKLYIDGALIGSADLGVYGESNSIANLSNDHAWLCKGGYDADPTWQGTVYEYNIYEGELNEAVIAQRGSEFVYGPGSYKNANLSGLSGTPGILIPEFDPLEDLYDLWVPYGTTTVDIDPVSRVSGATIEMYDGLGHLLPEDGVVSFTGDGIDVEIIVTALDGSTERSYYLSIFLDPSSESATLSDIELSAGALTTDFHPDTLHYIAILPYGTTSVEVTGIKTWEGATMVGGGTVVLTDGMGSTTITVTSEDGERTNIYTVDVYESKVTTGKYYYIQHEASELFDLVVREDVDSYIRLMVPVKDDSAELFQVVESGVEGQYFLQNKFGHYLMLVPDPDPSNDNDDWNMYMVEVLPTDLDSCRFILDEFEPGSFKVKSVARINNTATASHVDMGTNSPDEVGGGIYNDKWPGNDLATWNFVLPEDIIPPFNTYLDTLSIGAVPLSPDFEFYITTFYVTLPVGTTSLDITAEAQDPTAAVTGTGTIDVSDGEGTITITVTATNPEYSREYVIHYIEDTPLTLMHSYTFADGTAQDQAGDLDGVVHAGSITDGAFISANEGDYITLSGEDLALNTYPSITLEAYVTTGENPGYTMLGYFGGPNGSQSYWMSIARDDDVSKTAIDINGWGGANEDGVVGFEPAVGENHHYVSVLTNDTIQWYIDGVLIGKSALRSTYMINRISTEGAWICYGGYNDPTWIGSLYEFNIYSGQMDPQTAALHAIDFPIEDSTSDAALSDLMLDGVTIDDFSPYRLSYDVVQPEGTTTVPLVTATTRISTASAVVTDAEEVNDTATVVVTAEDGITTVTYMVIFSIELSDEATLSDLTVDGITVDGFDPDKISYTVELPYGTTVVPTVAGTATDMNADVVVNPAADLPGTTTVVVTAEDGKTVKTYSIKFELGTAVKKLNGSTIKVYPTVSDGSFMVETPGVISTVTVYDITGRVVLKQTGEGYEQTISVPYAGIYIVKVDCEGATKIFKVFKIN